MLIAVINNVPRFRNSGPRCLKSEVMNLSQGVIVDS
jgi:hypothetical protein